MSLETCRREEAFDRFMKAKRALGKSLGRLEWWQRDPGAVIEIARLSHVTPGNLQPQPERRVTTYEFKVIARGVSSLVALKAQLPGT